MFICFCILRFRKRIQYHSLTFVAPCIIVQFIKKNRTRRKNVPNFIIPYLYEAQHVSGDTPPIIRSLKLHWQPLVFHNIVEGCLYVYLVDVARHGVPGNVHQLHIQQLSTYDKPEAASAVLGSRWWAVCRLKHAEFHINME